MVQGEEEDSQAKIKFEIKYKISFYEKYVSCAELAYFLFYIKKSLVNLEKQNDKKYS